ncbi:MAG: cyclase family protein [Candidatus Latescibacterota bacterium]|jgi:kynurenine formamidase
MIIDLSHPFYSGMPVYPGDSETIITQHNTFDREGFSVHTLFICSHAGTHIDAPFHFFPHGKTVDTQSVLDACIGSARVLDATSVSSGAEIFPGDIGISPESITPGERILIATGWSERFEESDYFEGYPSISMELVTLFIERGITLLGVETPSLHLSRSDEIHKKLLDAGIVIVENLVNLSQLAGKSIFFSAAPLKLLGLDGSPVRAYAII